MFLPCGGVFFLFEGLGLAFPGGSPCVETGYVLDRCHAVVEADEFVVRLSCCVFDVVCSFFFGSLALDVSFAGGFDALA